jgi:hypothetical protein
MTVSSTITKVVYSGNGSTAIFPITFNYANASEVVAYLTDALGLITKITTNINVNSSTNQVTYPVSGSPLAPGLKLTLIRETAIVQEVVLTTQGYFNPPTIESAFDKLTRMDQEVASTLARCVKFPIDQTPTATDTDTYLTLINNSKAAATASQVAALASEAAALASKNAAGVSETNSAASAAASLVSKNAAGVSETNALASKNAAAISETNALASKNAAGVSETNALASKNAAAISETNSAASAAASLVSKNAAAATYLSFDERYLGAKTVAPTLDNQGVALLVGALYWNSVSNKMYSYDGAIWKELAGGGGGISAWLTGHGYIVDDIVHVNNKIFKCLAVHTSGTFATNLAAVDWVELSQGVIDHAGLSNIGTNSHVVIDTHIADLANPHAVTKAQVGLGNVVNTDTTTTANITDSTDKRFVTDLILSQTKASTVVNYITNPKLESDIVGFNTYKTAAQVNPTTGTTGTALYASLSRTTTSPLRGTASLLLTKTAFNAQGEGVSYDFTIDNSDKGKVITASFEYQIASGTYADNDLSVWIYDITNATLIQPAPYLIKNSGIIEKQSCEFQTAINSTSYRLIIHCASVSDLAYSIKFDNFIVGPQAKSYGSAITDWVTFTPTGSWITNATYTGKYRKVGGQAEFNIKVALSGAPTSVNLTVNLPLVMDTSVMLSSSTNSTNIGYGTALGSASTHLLSVAYSNTTSVIIAPVGTASAYADVPAYVNQAVPFTFANGNSVSLHFTAPIQGWSSSQVMSSDSASSPVVLIANSVTINTVTQANSNSNSSIQKFNAVLRDSVGGYDPSTGVYTVKIPGQYRVSSGLYIQGNTGSLWAFGVFQNGVQRSYSNASTAGKDDITGATLECKAGDTIDIRPSYNGGSAGTVSVGLASAYRDTLNIDRISGPSQVAASESVSASASFWLSANFTASPTIPLNFDSKEWDSHGAVTTSPTAWKFTAPISGSYTVSEAVDTSTIANYYVYKNGIIYKWLGSGAANVPVNLTTTIKLLAGEYLDVRPHASSTAFGGTLAASVSNITITRTGNY